MNSHILIEVPKVKSSPHRYQSLSKTFTLLFLSTASSRRHCEYTNHNFIKKVFSYQFERVRARILKSYSCTLKNIRRVYNLWKIDFFSPIFRLLFLFFFFFCPRKTYFLDWIRKPYGLIYSLIFLSAYISSFHRNFSFYFSPFPTLLAYFQQCNLFKRTTRSSSPSRK